MTRKKQPVEAQQPDEARSTEAALQEEEKKKLKVYISQGFYVAAFRPWQYERVAVREDGYFEEQLTFDGKHWYVFRKGYLEEPELKEEQQQPEG